MNYTLQAETNTYRLTGYSAGLTYVPKHITADMASYALSGPAITFKRTYALHATFARYELTNFHAILNFPEQETLLRDELAIGAISAQEFFVPTMYSSRPTVVLDVDHAQGLNSTYAHRSTVINFYNQPTKVWNDASYANQFAGEAIPSYIKATVAEQEFLYAQYVLKDAAWIAEYNREKILQWPYYWADELLARR